MSTDQLVPETTVEENEVVKSYDYRPAAHLAVFSLVILAVIAVVTSMAMLGPVIIPLVTAIFLFFVIRPFTNFLLRWHVPRWITYVMIVVGLSGIVYLLSIMISQDADHLVKQLPEMQERADALIEKIPFAGKSLNTEKLSETLDLKTGEVFQAMFGTVWHFVESVLLVLFYLVFVLLDADRLPGRILLAFPSKGPGMVRAFDKISDGISRYLRVKTYVSLGMAVSVAIILLCFGVSNWLLWAFVTFLLNYITYIGSLMALVPPIAFSLLEFDHLGIWLALVGLLFLNRFLWIDFLEIRYTGQQLRINNAILLFSIVFWGWFWGITGMVLAVPMISALRIILSQIDRTRPIAIMISED